MPISSSRRARCASMAERAVEPSRNPSLPGPGTFLPFPFLLGWVWDLGLSSKYRETGRTLAASAYYFSNPANTNMRLESNYRMGIYEVLPL